MSSRRGAGEENILAMLERDSARRMGPRMSRVRLASYGAAAALAGVLAGGIAWLAYDNHQSAQELQVAHDAADLAVPVPMPDPVLPPQAPPVVAAANPVDAPRTALIVDESARKHDTAAASAVPPLVMLPPHEVAGTKPPPGAGPAQESVQDRVQAKPARPEPIRVAARTEKKAEKASRPAGRPAKAAKPAKPVQARNAGAAKAKSEASARTRKPASAADAPVDRDVALISAIIQHSERHRGESGCTGPRCPAKPARP